MNENCDKECDKESEQNMLLLWKLKHTAAIIEARLEAALEGTGLSLSKGAVLDRLIKADEPLPLTRLAGQLACVKSNVTQLVDRLEADGLVERRDDPEDRRSILATITDEGRRRYEIGVRALTAAGKDLLKSFKQDEIELLDQLLKRLNND
ncbi:MAG: MarR family winged helix-turn-helix transcriptional regulator [Ignavibacteriales bacterium]